MAIFLKLLTVFLFYFPFLPSFFHTFQAAKAEQAKVAAQFENETQVAKSQRDFQLKKAAYDQEVNDKKAQSELAYPLQVKQEVIILLFTSWV